MSSIERCIPCVTDDCNSGVMSVSPYLTIQGKWVFVTGALFTLLGALVREPLLVLFGQVPFGVLILAAAVLIPAARSLDRRSAQLRVDSEEKTPSVMRLKKDGATLAIWFENHSRSVLHVHRISPHVEGAIDVEMTTVQVDVEPHRARRLELKARPLATGRSSIQGVDVMLVDRWGLLAVHDYLPCLQVFETHPSMEPLRWRRAQTRSLSRARSAPVVDRSNRSGTDLRELRDFQPGDPLRTIAWKATVRQRRLITREYDDERNEVDYIALDISSSMRAGTPRGEKFRHAIEVTAGFSAHCLSQGRRVGLWTFDDRLYGEVVADHGPAQRRRIQRHLVGLKSVVASERTVLDEPELEEALADYLLVQERLDFRQGAGLRGELDRQLLRRWLDAVMASERQRWESSAEAYGVLDDSLTAVRRFFRLRGIPLDPPSEVRAGAKVSGLEAVVQAAVRRRIGGGQLTIISDLCGLNDVEALHHPISVARRRGTRVRFVVPFTPHYGDPEDSEDFQVMLIRDLFTRAERKDRLAVVERLASMGLSVEWIGPPARDRTRSENDRRSAMT